MKVLVCGGRDNCDGKAVFHVLDKFYRERGVDVIINGNARGIDRIAGFWAHKNGVTEKRYRANWEEHGRAAGPIRNQKMLDEATPDVVIAFPGGKGTAHMTRIAREAGVEVIEVRPTMKAAT